MKAEILTIGDIKKYEEYLPSHVIQDVDKRITDWVESGGTFEDDYVKNQFRYLERILETTDFSFIIVK